MEAIQTYQSVEQQYRTKHKQRLERQIKIGTYGRPVSVPYLLTFFVTAVKPNATPDEVRAIVNNENNTQIFSQAVSFYL